jgi:hypothetical protein
MRTLLIALALMWLAAPARAEDAASPADKAAIQSVISRQIEAFRRNDGNAALSFAAPNVKEKFGDGPHFLDMVREHYPAVFRPRSVNFGALAPDGAIMVQHVELVGPDGQMALAIYEMIRDAKGAWLISGCSLVRSERQET